VVVAPVFFAEGKMSKFQHPLWGYELTYPDNWVHRTLPDTEGFASNPAALEVNAQGPGSGHILIRSDWNGTRQPVEQLWGQHIGQAAGMLMAKNVGSAPWQMGGAAGFEAEIVLPKRDDRRLWVGMLGYGFVLVQLMVVHPIVDREWFEPAATEIIKSLRFPLKMDGIPRIMKGFQSHPSTKQSIPPPLSQIYNRVTVGQLMTEKAAPAVCRHFTCAKCWDGVGGWKSWCLTRATPNWVLPA
jgi:hypothetical protein